jgi:hypothetical protein
LRTSEGPFSSNGDALYSSHGRNFRFIDLNLAVAVNAGRMRLYLMWDLDAAIADVDDNIYGQRAAEDCCRRPIRM